MIFMVLRKSTDRVSVLPVMNECGIHYWDDYVYIEIIDPKLPESPFLTEKKERLLLLPWLKRELLLFVSVPMIFQGLFPGHVPCGSKYPRLDIIKGRSDDMFKVHGVNMFPSQIEDLLSNVDGVSSEYNVTYCS